jgi:KipI family sensor histidine kinase inhibitor
MCTSAPTWPLIAPLGDAAVRIDCGNPSDPRTAARVQSLTAALTRNPLAGVTDVVPSYSVVVAYFHPLRVRKTETLLVWERVAKWINRCITQSTESEPSFSREIVIPVCYGGEFGPDIEHVAKVNRLTVDDVISKHVGGSYTVRAVGFAPGFPYLEGLPAELHTPRRDSPRTRVPSGSVGIGGAQTGVYPLASPGGWNLIGRTPTRLFCTARSPAALLMTGDRVRFQSIKRADFDELKHVAEGQSTKPVDITLCDPVLEVLSPGLQTTIQDLGRPGHQVEGVTPGGSMDTLAARVANLLVGNAEGAPVLEAVQSGPKLRAIRDAVMAITGAHVNELPGWRPLFVAGGQVVDCSKIIDGGRAYVAVSGGLAADPFLSGRGTDLTVGVGGYRGRTIARGDQLCRWNTPAIQATSDHGNAARWFVEQRTLAPQEANGRLRVLRGPQSSWFSDATWTQLTSSTFVVTPSSNRTGLRLQGPSIQPVAHQEMVSEPVVQGAIQVPPDGQPILLGADRQTIGGYPTIGCVISVDLPLLGQLCPGSEVRFAEVRQAEAESLLHERERNLAILTHAIQQHA